MQHFLTFKEISSEQLAPALIGGKASSLVRLYQQNFLVPEGFVITTEFFNLFSEENKPIEFSDQDIKTINQYIDGCSPHGLVAVRSSASVEDSSSQSYAGQFDSFLNVAKDDIPEMVRKCWGSMYNIRAQQYARSKNTNLKMAVIVQKMISSDVSGVAFSANPVTGDKGSIVIEAVLGSNELLVQGAITPDLYIVSSNLTILDKKIVPQAENHQQKLSDDQIIEVARLVADVKEFFNVEVDMEWAIGNGKLLILQSRPITTVQ
jgi:rifampicin phosphotransferase